MVGRVVAGALSVFAVVAMGPWHLMAMDFGDPSAMSNCILMVSEATPCTMDIFAHISYSQTMFVTTVPRMVVTAFLLLFLFTVVLVRRWLMDVLVCRFTVWLSWYACEQRTIVATYYLKQAFSQGILHPKIY